MGRQMVPSLLLPPSRVKWLPRLDWVAGKGLDLRLRLRTARHAPGALDAIPARWSDPDRSVPIATLPRRLLALGGGALVFGGVILLVAPNASSWMWP